jgi:hypothetical protein
MSPLLFTDLGVAEKFQAQKSALGVPRQNSTTSPLFTLMDTAGGGNGRSDLAVPFVKMRKSVRRFH